MKTTIEMLYKLDGVYDIGDKGYIDGYCTINTDQYTNVLNGHLSFIVALGVINGQIIPLRLHDFKVIGFIDPNRL